MLSQKQNTVTGKMIETITLDELYAMQQEVAAVTIPQQINELMDDVLCELRQKGIHVSDRKYLNYYPIVQASAWLGGQWEVESIDLLALKNYLWTTSEEISIIKQVLDRLCINPMQEKLNGIALMARDSYDEFMTDSNTRALIKLRGEFVKLYGMIQEQRANAINDNEKALADAAVGDLEELSQSAHEAARFTYAPLEE